MFAIEKYTVKQDSYSIAKQMVKAQGNFKHIASGAYGAVYGAKDNEVVYKIGDASDNDGYISFIKVLSKQKKQNPFLPKIYGVRFIRGKGGNEHFVVAMERLTSLDRGLGDVSDWFRDELYMGSGYSSKAEQALGVKKTTPKPLKDALAVLRQAHRASCDADWDLHNGNFMMRGKQIVVTDPLA